MTDVAIRTALLSVSDKSGLLQLVEKLREFDVSLLSTGGTHKMIQDAGHSVTEVADYTGFPEMMDGRVKTLHPKVHGGLLGRRDQDADVMREHDIDGIDLLVCNLYPFEAAVAAEPNNLENAIENIDIGGPAMVRSAAKNFESVAVIVNQTDYENVITELDARGGKLSRQTRFDLARKAYEAIARYDAAIANHLGRIDLETQELNDYPNTMTLQFSRQESMRYGENPHQSAAFYVEANQPPGSIASSTQLQGKALSYNNVTDTDAALQCVQAFDEPACVIVKHANPCGVAEGSDLAEAYDRAFKTDPTSAFGGIIAFNGAVDASLAQEIVDRQFVEVIAAPGFSEDALAAVAAKKNVRVLLLGDGTGGQHLSEYKRVSGGLLVQSSDVALIDELKVVTERTPTDSESADLMFAWKVAKFVKSNAIVYAKERMTIGIGAGQMARVISAKIAAMKAQEEGLQVQGSVMASDAFFPFRDSIDAAAEAGITAIIQPGGSIKDDEVIAAANEADIAMLFTGMRHFRH